MWHEANEVPTLPWGRWPQEGGDGTGHPKPTASQLGNLMHMFWASFLRAGGFWPFPTKPPVPFPSRLPEATTGMGKPTERAGSVAILPRSGPF